MEENMERSDRIRFIVITSIIALVIVAFVAVMIVPVFISIFSEKKANEAISLVLSDQTDGSLSSETIVKVNSKYFVYIDGLLKELKEDADTSAAVTTASNGKNVTVFLFAEDGMNNAYTLSSGINYTKFIDPNDNSIETYTYSQVTEPVQRFLDEVSYENAEDSVSEIAKYVDPSVRYDRPAGCTVELKAGELTIYDNGTQNAYAVTVQEGPYTFYNITPNVGGEFYVKNGDEVIQKGHLRPTGTLRMIYSDTSGLQNMRDLGGWSCDGGTVKYNLLIRGGKVIDASDIDRNTWVKLIGIKNDVFLKTYDETELIGKEEYRDKSPLGQNVSLYQQDLSENDSENKRNYTHAKEQLNGIINTIFDNAINGETTYFHCLAGADRTGMVAILVEGVLGISKSDIDKDYELTSFSTLRERNGEIYKGDINILRSYPGETFRDKCIYYLLDCGIDLEKINAFRNAVIDGEPEEIFIPEIAMESATNFCKFSEEGWIDGGRCSSTGADRKDSPSYIVTNYIEVQNGDIVYIKNLHTTDVHYSGMYKTDKTEISGFVVSASGSEGFIKDVELSKHLEQFTIDNPDVGYIRLCGMPEDNEKDIVICIYRNGEWL